MRGAVVLRPRGKSLDPREFDATGFDLIAELRSLGAVDPFAAPTVTLAIHGWPETLSTSIDKVRYQAYRSAKPATGTVVSLALEHAVDALEGHPDVEALVLLKERLSREEHADGEAEELVAEFYRSFRMSVGSFESQRRRNFWVEPQVKSRLSGLAGDLGLQSSTLAVLGLQLTFSTQAVIHIDTREKYAHEVARCLRRVRLRADATHALMEALL